MDSCIARRRHRRRDSAPKRSASMASAALRPFEPDEVRLLEIISRGEHQIAGFRNRDVREAL